jgi:hypothetical protein
MRCRKIVEKSISSPEILGNNNFVKGKRHVIIPQ